MKNFKVRITPQAASEFKLAKEWYKQLKIKGLSNRFAESIKDTIRRVQDNPEAFAKRYRDERIAHAKVFPYAVHFSISDSTVIVTAIIFQGRDPLVARSRNV